MPSDFRFGSLADIASRPRHVRYSLKADIRQRGLHVRFVPIADIEHQAQPLLPAPPGSRAIL